MRMHRFSSLHLRTRGNIASTRYSRSLTYSSSLSYTFSSKSFRPSAKFPGLIRIFSTASATSCATTGWKCMSAHRGMVYPLLNNPSRILAAAFASRLPWTVMRTRSNPLSAQRMICSMDASTLAVSVVAIVCRTMGWSLPNLIGPQVTVRVLRRDAE